MKAMTIEKFGELDQIHLVDLPTPQPQENEVQIEIEYAGVNPVDGKITKGLLKDRMPHHWPIVLGWDGAGTVSAVGSRVKNFTVGDKVYAYFRKPTIQWGTFCQFACLPAENVVLIPNNLSFAQAAAIPLSALTAWQAIFSALKLKKGESILIHAGAGGVGGYALQFAHLAGAKVYTTSSTKNHDYVERLGADVAIDYTQESFVDRIQRDFPNGIDAVFDTVGGKTLERSYEVLREGGRLAGIVQPPDAKQAKGKTITAEYVFVQPSGKDLTEISKLIEEKKVLPPDVQEMSLNDAAKAIDQVLQGHTRGKLVLRVKG